MHSTGVVSNHSAQVAILMRRGIRAEGKTIFVGAVAQIVEHDSRLNPRVFFLRVDLQNLVQVFGKINDYSHVAGLTAKTRSATARQQRRAMLVRQRNGLDHIFYSFGNNNANRDLAIVGTIHRVKSACAVVKVDFAGNRGAQFGGQDFSVGARKFHLPRHTGARFFRELSHLLTSAARRGIMEEILFQQAIKNAVEKQKGPAAMVCSQPVYCPSAYFFILSSIGFSSLS